MVIIPSSNAYGPNYANAAADRNAVIPSSNAYGPNYANPNTSRSITYPNGMVVPNPADRFAVYVNDPDYVQYRLKKNFDDNWTASGK